MFDTLRSRLAEPRARIQVLAGPRQTGRTTLARQVLASLDRPSAAMTTARTMRVWG